MLRILACMAILGACHGEIWCTKCNKARGGNEDNCNNQDINGGNDVLCGDREVCTIDVSCDRQGRVVWIKGCEKKARIDPGDFNKLLCKPDGSLGDPGTSVRCRYHCTPDDYCNAVAPADMVAHLHCTPPPTQCQCHAEPHMSGQRFPQLTDYAGIGPTDLISAADDTKVKVVLTQTEGPADDTECRYKVEVTLRKDELWPEKPYYITQVMVHFGKAVLVQHGYRRLLKIKRGQDIVEISKIEIINEQQGGEERPIPFEFYDAEVNLKVMADMFSGSLHIWNSDCKWVVMINAAPLAVDRAVWIGSPAGAYTGACGDACN